MKPVRDAVRQSDFGNWSPRNIVCVEHDKIARVCRTIVDDGHEPALPFARAAGHKDCFTRLTSDAGVPTGESSGGRVDMADTTGVQRFRVLA